MDDQQPTTEKPDKAAAQYLGQHTHVLDSKDRIAIPAKYLPKENGKRPKQEFVLVASPSTPFCIEVYDYKTFPFDQINMVDLGPYIEKVTTDVSGRISISEKMVAHLDVDPEERKVIIAGHGDFIEICETRHWLQQRTAREKKASEAYEKLHGQGSPYPFPDAVAEA